MSDRIQRAMREMGFMDAVYPGDQLRHDQAVRKAIDEAGKLDPSAAEDLRTPITLDWSTIDGRPKRSPQSGDLVLLWAHANTAPSSGPCIVTYTFKTKQQGATPLPVVVRIEQNQEIGEVTLAQPLPAGAYLNPSVTSAGGASGVSTGLVIKVG